MLNSWMTRAVLGRTSVSNALHPGDKPDAAFEASWRGPFKTRLLIMFGLVLGWAVALEAQLVWLQVVSHDRFVASAKDQQEEIFEPDALRGDIRDRNGELLAITVGSYRVIASPKHVDDPRQVMREICQALMDCTREEREQLEAKLSSGKAYAHIRSSRFVSPDAAIRLEALVQSRIAEKKPAVLTLIPESRRYYPKFKLASHVIGAVGFDGQGVSGVENRFNSHIAGTKGRVRVLMDAGLREISSIVERPATTGASIELTIDVRLQHLAERELKAAIDAHNALGGSVVILQPFTGEILAQANYPSFNPNDSGAYADADRRNRAIQEIYEPGSTFKIVTASAALNDGLMTPSDLVDTNPGVIRIQGRKPIDEVNGKNYGVLTFEDVFVKSSNVGAIRIGERIGGERLRSYAEAFGFNQKLATEFAGETRGQLRAGSLDESSRASISMGYEIGVTPLQVASAVSVIANGGLLMEPRVRRAEVRSGVRTEFQPKVLRRVISPETAATMTTIMEAVAERGTATKAALERYRVAGKTGTASKLVNRRYSDTDYNVSFAGFVPSNKPELTILVVIDRPRVARAYGGTIAAPVFKRIAEAALQQVGVAPTLNPAPPIISASNRTVQHAAPPPVPAQQPRIVRVDGRPVMPDLRGLSMREAIRLANEIGVFMKTEGDGMVVTQTPLPGEFVEHGRSGTLQLQRYPPVPRGER